MDYKKYFERLIAKNKEKKDFFPRKKVFSHSRNNYYSNPYRIRGLKYSFVISSKNSRVYGKDFEGFIVELLFDGKNCVDNFTNFYEYKEKIEEELDIDNVVWQKPKDKNSKRCRIYASLKANIEDERGWGKYINWQIETMIKFLKVLPKYSE